jgi:GT2 family glycosyltransferase
MLDLTVIIVTWNARSCIEDCLRSITPLSADHGTRIIVVDNNSTDGTVSYIETTFPDVSLIKNKENIGFAAASNQGFRLARSPILLLLNPDTVVRPGALEALAECLLGHEDAWAAGPAMFSADGTPQRTGVRFPTNWNLLVESLFLDRFFPRSMFFGQHRALYEDPVRFRTVDFLQGACLMVRREVIERIGGLDEEFFMYFEETDWCYRMHEAGGKVYYCPLAQVVHLGGGDIGHYDERRLVHFHDSLLLFYRKHYTFARVVGVSFILGLRSVLRMAIWIAVALLKPSLRSKALSSVKGYQRVFGQLLRSA